MNKPAIVVKPGKASSAHRTAKKRVRSYMRTDSGNAELFADLWKDNLRYDHARKRWLIWRGHWWAEDRTGTVVQLAKNTVRRRYKNARDIDDETVRQQEFKWAARSESRSGLESILKLAQSDPLLSDAGEGWDQNPWLLGVKNGVIDLRTGNLRDGHREDQITMYIGVVFDANAKCPLWMKFLQQVFDDNQELIVYIWRSLGYCMTGSTQEQCIFYAHGGGSNGKSTFLEAIRHVLGPYAGAAPFSMFEQKNKAAIPNDVASSVNKRLITASETDESARLNESRIKTMTGGDKQSARFLYKDFFEYEPTAKIWLAFNHKPQIKDDSHGMWRRVRLIPFQRTFTKDEADKQLNEKLLAEAPGILAWMVRGCIEWQKHGLKEPALVVDATEQYKAENDIVGAFIDECCQTGSKVWVAPSEIQESFKKWTEETGLEGLSPQEFKRRLQAKGFQQSRVGHCGNRRWVGIGLKGAAGDLLAGTPVVKVATG